MSCQKFTRGFVCMFYRYHRSKDYRGSTFTGFTGDNLTYLIPYKYISLLLVVIFTYLMVSYVIFT